MFLYDQLRRKRNKATDMTVVTLDVDIMNSTISRDGVYFIYMAYMSKIRSISRLEEAFSRLSLSLCLPLSLSASCGDWRQIHF